MNAWTMKSGKQMIMGLATAAFLSGCTVGPNFTPPEAPAVSTYTSAADALPVAQRVELGKHIESQWWRLFASKPLNALIRQAVTSNYSLHAAQQTLAQAQEAARAQSGSLWPNVSLGATSGRQKYGVALFGPADFAIPAFSYDEIGPTVSWTLDLFGGERRNRERMRALVDYQSRQLDAAYVELTGNVVAVALGMASAQARMDVINRIIAEDEKTLKLVQASFDAGAGTRVDILSARSQLIADQALIPPMKQQISTNRHALAILLGKQPSAWTPPPLTLDEFTLPRSLPVRLPSELARTRPDIMAAEANLHAASAAIGVATANLYPKITLSANLMQEALNPAGLFHAANDAWSAAAGLSAPLFNGGELSAQKQAAEDAYRVALDQYQQTVLNAFGQVADALTAIAHDEELIATWQQSVDTARSSLDLARKSYQAGNTGLMPIEDAQRHLAQAQLGITEISSQRYLDCVRLFVALGGSPMS